MNYCKNHVFSIVFLGLLLTALPLSARECHLNGLTIFGNHERARLETIQHMEVDALIDSGATTTALDARNIRMYINRQGRRWVYYDFFHKPSGRTVAMNQPVSRVSRVITHSGAPRERAVVMNTVRIGNTRRHLEMSLINRSNFPQQLLIGINYLAGTALVDSGQRYLQGHGGRR